MKRFPEKVAREIFAVLFAANNQKFQKKQVVPARRWQATFSPRVLQKCMKTRGSGDVEGTPHDAKKQHASSLRHSRVFLIESYRSKNFSAVGQ
ncbi:hypothetical protein GYB59_15340 [bacterium]|nr:hypothetical protein [bacterium]